MFKNNIMFKNKIMYGLILILLLLIYFHLCKENFNTHYDVNKDILPDETNFHQTETSKDYISYLNRKDMVFNNNYNAVWLKPPVSYNNPNVNNLSSGIHDYKEEVTSYTYYIHINTMKHLINKFNKKFTVDYNTFKIKLEAFGKLTKVTNNLGNEKTWVNKYFYDSNKNIPTEIIKSKFSDVNIIITNVLDKLNIIFKNYYDKQLKHKYKKFKFYPFFIFKYKITKYHTSKKNFLKSMIFINKYIKIFEIILCIVRQNDINVIELYITAYIDENNKTIFQNILFIGNAPLSNYLIHPGITKPNYYDVHNPKIKDNVTFENAEKILKEQYEKNTDQFSIEHQYRCFDIQKDGLIISTNNKLDCENEIDWYGRIKNYGIWDRPCISDNECIYYKKNKNYDNSYGKCSSSGYCQMPINTKKLGYHFERPESEPKCYNCNTQKWMAFTQLDNCCEQQDKESKKYNKKKYGFLKGPDYAFNDDLNTRINHNIKQKYDDKEIYIKYKDLFDKDKFTYYFQ